MQYERGLRGRTTPNYSISARFPHPIGNPRIADAYAVLQRAGNYFIGEVLHHA